MALTKVTYSMIEGAPANVLDFGAIGDGVVDCTIAIQTAINSGAGAVYFPKGVYRCVDPLDVPANIILYGDGLQVSIVLRDGVNDPAKKHQGLFNIDSGSASAFIDNVKFSNLGIHGTVATTGFSEFNYLLSLGGARNLQIESCSFVGFRGDGIFFGSGFTDATERHNVDVLVLDCVFDGVNKDNRNAISVLDVTGLTVQNCIFKNTTRADMPGAIDLEPENTFNTIRDVLVESCSFRNIGGNGGVFLYLDKYNLPRTPSPNNIKVLNNTFRDCDNSRGTWGVSCAVSAGPSTPPLDFEFSDNVISNTIVAGFVVGTSGVSHFRNTYRNVDVGLFLGFEDNGGIYQFTSCDNIYTAVGRKNDGQGGYAAQIRTASTLLFSREKFVDVGRANGTLGYVFYFNTGVSDGVIIDNIAVYSPTNKTTYSIKKEIAHTFTPESNRFSDNTLTIAGNDFAWKSYDYANYTSATQIAGIPEGFTASAVNDDAGTPTALGTGLLVTNKFRDPVNLNYTNTSFQWFYPTDVDTAAADEIYFRKISSITGDWDVWLLLTGV